MWTKPHLYAQQGLTTRLALVKTLLYYVMFFMPLPFSLISIMSFVSNWFQVSYFPLVFLHSVVGTL